MVCPTVPHWEPSLLFMSLWGNSSCLNLNGLPLGLGEWAVLHPEEREPSVPVVYDSAALGCSGEYSWLRGLHLIFSGGYVTLDSSMGSTVHMGHNPMYGAYKATVWNQSHWAHPCCSMVVWPWVDPWALFSLIFLTGKWAESSSFLRQFYCSMYGCLWSFHIYSAWHDKCWCVHLWGMYTHVKHFCWKNII